MKSIGDFAENLIIGELQDIQEGKSLPSSNIPNSPSLAPAGRDIRNTEVPNSFMSEVLGEEYTPILEEEVVVEAPPVESSQESSPNLLTEATAQELIPLLMDVRNLLSEMMTTAGSLGVNLGAPSMDISKMGKGDGYISPCRASSKKKRSRKNILKQSIRDRVRRLK